MTDKKNTNKTLIKAIIFDMGNVILKVDHMLACQKFSELSGVKKVDFPLIFSPVFGGSL